MSPGAEPPSPSKVLGVLRKNWRCGLAQTIPYDKTFWEKKVTK